MITIVIMITIILQLFHHIGSLLPPEEAQPKFLQVYFLDTFAEQASVRGGRSLSQEIIRNLTDWFHHNNHYVRELKTAKEIIEECTSKNERS